MDASLTDAAVESLGNALSFVLIGRISTRGTQRKQPSVDAVIDNPQLMLPGLITEATDQDGEHSSEVQNRDESSPAPGSDHEKLRRLFRPNGNTLEIEDPRLKASSQLDYARRLTYLFLYASELEGRTRVPRADLNAILDDAGVNDGNTQTWIRKNNALVKDDDLIGLNTPGREEARKALNHAFDTNAVDKWLPGESRSRSAKSPKVDGKAQAKDTPSSHKKAAGKSKIVEEWAKKWKSLTPPIDGYSILKGKERAYQGVFGLWAIRHVMGEAGKVVSRKSYLDCTLQNSSMRHLT